MIYLYAILFILYVTILSFVFYYTANLLILGLKKPRPEVYQLTEDDKKALEDYRKRKEASNG